MQEEADKSKTLIMKSRSGFFDLIRPMDSGLFLVALLFSFFFFVDIGCILWSLTEAYGGLFNATIFSPSMSICRSSMQLGRFAVCLVTLSIYMASYWKTKCSTIAAFVHPSRSIYV